MISPERIVIATRESRLALWQAEHVRALLRQLYPACSVELLGMTTRGDQILDRPLAKVGGKGLFVKELETALLDGSADIAVHSMKDVPMELPPEFALVATGPRELPLDAFVSSRYASLDDMPPGAVVGTSSLRREAQLHANHPSLAVTSLRGNLDTRLRKVAEGQYDAIVLAAAGLKRLGWEDRIAEILPLETMCPAVGQGALAIETRQDGGDGQQACAILDHLPTRLAVTAERAVLAELGGGCQVPIGAHAVVDGARIRLRAVVVSPDGSILIRREVEGSAAEGARLGAELARELLDAGGQEILESVYGPR